jgi:LacI family transcriptional regulator
MINESSDATAIQASSDAVAIGCAQALLQQGLKIPGDLSITGFGNIPIGEYFQVPLTTVRQPKYRLGLAAVAAMQQLLHGHRPDSKPLEAELVVRSSTGAPRRGT